MVTVYCEAQTCKYHNGIGCDADFITINDDGECMGFKEDVDKVK